MKNIGLVFEIIMLVVAAGCRERNTVLSDPGISLPEEPEMPAFAAETVALNDEAVELLGSDGERALALLDQAIAQQPNYYPAYANQGTLFIEKKQYHEAAQCVVFILGYKDLALQEIEAILRKDPDFSLAQTLRTEIESTDENDPWTILGLD